jgi:hypothetical protein
LGVKIFQLSSLLILCINLRINKLVVTAHKLREDLMRNFAKRDVEAPDCRRAVQQPVRMGRNRLGWTSGWQLAVRWAGFQPFGPLVRWSRVYNPLASCPSVSPPPARDSPPSPPHPFSAPPFPDPRRRPTLLAALSPPLPPP